jgi:heptaprenyl diphosphate synthase
MSMGADAFGLPLGDPVLSAAVADGMERVEKALDEAVQHVDGFISEASGHLLAAGGKRFRPLSSDPSRGRCRTTWSRPRSSSS